MKIYICDDNLEQLEQIRNLTEQYFVARQGWGVQIDVFENALMFLKCLDKTGGCDIALLDICMPGLLGTDVAKEIRSRHDQTEIIFLTTSDEYAVDAFALKAAHYLIKPFTKKQFDEAMDRAVARFADGTVKKIAVKSEGGCIQTLDINDVYYIERQQHTLIVYTKNGIYTEARRSLARFMEELEKLSPGQFIAPYKGYLVNQRAIAAMDPKKLVMYGGARIPIPSRSYREIQNTYFDYMFPESEVEK